MAEGQGAASRLFREPGKVESIQCPRCGGAITLKTYGASERVACPFCGSLLGPDESGALALVQAASRKRQATTLALHRRGVLDGITWEVIGICVRSVVVDGERYPWEEFFLYNPYRGFRWLVHSLSDHHWTFGQTLDAAPLQDGGSLRCHGRDFAHFQGGQATVDYVEGEFTWQVEVGDVAGTDDYVAPPLAISLEFTKGPDGQEVNRTIQRHIDAREVWRAFEPRGPKFAPVGVGMVEPNPWRPRPWFLVAWVALIIAAAIGFALQAGSKGLLEVEVPGEAASMPVVQPLHLDGPTTVEVEIRVPGLSNQWAYYEGMLVDTASEEAIGFDLEVSYYSGIDGGESWSEGADHAAVVLADVPAGDYLLQIKYGSGAELGWDLRVTRGVFLVRYGLLFALAVLFGFILPLVLGALFEHRRWLNSDHA
ncbi:MAG: DUF4178 domain-containing protein [Nannocystaceae bacterium]